MNMEKKNNINIPKLNTEKLWNTTRNLVVKQREENSYGMKPENINGLKPSGFWNCLSSWHKGWKHAKCIPINTSDHCIPLI